MIGYLKLSLGTYLVRVARCDELETYTDSKILIIYPTMYDKTKRFLQTRVSDKIKWYDSQEELLAEHFDEFL